MAVSSPPGKGSLVPSRRSVATLLELGDDVGRTTEVAASRRAIGDAIGAYVNSREDARTTLTFDGVAAQVNRALTILAPTNIRLDRTNPNRPILQWDWNSWKGRTRFNVTVRHAATEAGPVTATEEEVVTNFSAQALSLAPWPGYQEYLRFTITPIILAGTFVSTVYNTRKTEQATYVSAITYVGDLSYVGPASYVALGTELYLGVGQLTYAGLVSYVGPRVYTDFVSYTGARAYAVEGLFLGATTYHGAYTATETVPYSGLTYASADVTINYHGNYLGPGTRAYDDRYEAVYVGSEDTESYHASYHGIGPQVYEGYQGTGHTVYVANYRGAGTSQAFYTGAYLSDEEISPGTYQGTVPIGYVSSYHGIAPTGTTPYIGGVYYPGPANFQDIISYGGLDSYIGTVFYSGVRTIPRYYVGVGLEPYVGLRHYTTLEHYYSGLHLFTGLRQYVDRRFYSGPVQYPGVHTYEDIDASFVGRRFYTGTRNYLDTQFYAGTRAYQRTLPYVSGLPAYYVVEGSYQGAATWQGSETESYTGSGGSYVGPKGFVSGS